MCKEGVAKWSLIQYTKFTAIVLHSASLPYVEGNISLCDPYDHACMVPYRYWYEAVYVFNLAKLNIVCEYHHCSADNYYFALYSKVQININGLLLLYCRRLIRSDCVQLLGLDINTFGLSRQETNIRELRYKVLVMFD